MSDQIFYVINPVYGGTRSSEHTNVFGMGVDADTAVGTNAAYSDIVEMDASQLQDYFEGDPLLQNQFGSFDTYMSYMTDLTSLVEEQGKWWEVDPEAEKAYNVVSDLNQAMLNGEDVDVVQTLQDELGIPAWQAYQYVGDTAAIQLGSAAGNSLGITLPDGSTINIGGTGVFADMGQFNAYDGTDTSITQSPLTEAQYYTGSAANMLNQFMASEGMQALNEQYGLDTQNVSQFMGEDGNVWQAQWTGTGWVTTKVKDFDSSIGLGEVVQIVGTTALTMGVGAALGAVAGLSGVAAQTAASGLVQMATTGEIDLQSLAVSAATQGLMDTEVMQAFESGLVDSVAGALPEGVPLSVVEDAVSGGLSGLASGALSGDLTVESFMQGVAVDVLSGVMQDVYQDWQNSQFESWLDEQEDLFGPDPFADTTAENAQFQEWLDMQDNMDFEDFLNEQEMMPDAFETPAPLPVDPETTIAEVEADPPAYGFNEDGTVANEDVAFSPPDTSGALTDVMDENDLLTDYEQQGPSADLAADYDPNTYDGQLLDNMTNDDVLGTVSMQDTTYGQMAGYEGDDVYTLFRGQDGILYVTSNNGGVEVYRGGDIGGGIDTAYDSLDWMDQHIAAEGAIPQGSTPTTVQVGVDQIETPAVTEEPVVETEQPTDVMADEVSSDVGGGGVTAEQGGSANANPDDSVVDANVTPDNQQSTAGGTNTNTSGMLSDAINDAINGMDGNPTADSGVEVPTAGGTAQEAGEAEAPTGPTGTDSNTSGGSQQPTDQAGEGGTGSGDGQATGGGAGTDGGQGGGTGEGDGGGVGDGSGGLGGSGTGTGGKPTGVGGSKAKDYMTGLGYQPYQLQGLFAGTANDNQKALEDLIKRSLGGSMFGGS